MDFDRKSLKSLSPLIAAALFGFLCGGSYRVVEGHMDDPRYDFFGHLLAFFIFGSGFFIGFLSVLSETRGVQGRVRLPLAKALVSCLAFVAITTAGFGGPGFYIVMTTPFHLLTCVVGMVIALIFRSKIRREFLSSVSDSDPS